MYILQENESQLSTDYQYTFFLIMSLLLTYLPLETKLGLCFVNKSDS